MDRITDKNLEAAVSRLNKALGRPDAAYTKRADGTLKANIGNFHLSHQYGGVCVHEMCSEGGGVKHALSMYGHGPKRDCWERLHAALWALEQVRAS